MGTLIEDLQQAVESEQASAMAAYRRLVRDVATGAEIDLAASRSVIQLAGRSLADFQRDAETLKRRIEADQALKTIPDREKQEAALRAETARATDEFEKVRKKAELMIEKARQKAAEARHAASVFNDQTTQLRRESIGLLRSTHDEELNDKELRLHAEIDQLGSNLIDVERRLADLDDIVRAESERLDKMSIPPEERPVSPMASRIESLRRQKEEIEGSVERAKSRLSAIEQERLDPYRQRWV